MLKQRVCAAKRNEREAIRRSGELRAVPEIFPKILHRFFAFVIRRADGEFPLDLAYEFFPTPRTVFTYDEEVVRIPAEVLCLETNFNDDTVMQNRWETAHKKLGKPICVYMLFKARACSAGGGGARDLFRRFWRVWHVN